ncbi:phage terminase small subunit [Lysinibacillus sp.]|uniref:phage terminase small subunit n=1 Tax=Lysinibacillus sp. TaxID=1869345 RepID=UPI0028A2306C|nr:phage terminase small subunit [Lysinibacillus sp.]
MARKRDPRRDEAFEIYKEHNGKITNRKIAEMLDVPEKTIGSWKSKAKDNWEEKLSGVLQTSKRSTPKAKDTSKADGSTKETSNRSGNPNPSHKFSEHNSHALKHGLFSRYIPKETLEIMSMVAKGDEENLLWMQIQIQFSAIIRAQEIMFVKNQEEMVKELKREKLQGGKNPSQETEYEIQFAWDRQERFLNAQTRAIGELRASIKQYLELPFIEEEKRKQLSLMAEQVAKLAKENTPNTSTEDKLKDYFTALQGAFKDVETES